MSRRTFTRQFYKATGMSMGEWLTAERLQRSQELLEFTSLPIDTIAAQVGFLSATSLRQHFKHQFDVTPGEWRKTFQGKRPATANHRGTHDVRLTTIPCGSGAGGINAPIGK